MRFNRVYTFRALADNRELEVTEPFRIQFDALKSVTGFGLNKLRAKLYGLGESARSIFIKTPEQQRIVRVELLVGYAGQRSRIFSGNLHRGDVQLTADGYVVTIECYDGGLDYFNAYTSRTIRGKDNAIDAIISDMPNTVRGKVRQPETLTRPKVLVGRSYELLEDLTAPQDRMYVDDGKVFIIGPDDVTSEYIPVVSPETGLMNTPEKEFSRVTFDSVLNPYVRIGSRVELISVVTPQYNGTYKVDTIAYKGDLEGEDWRQTITGFNLGVAQVL